MLRKAYWGRHLQARGYLAVSTANMTDEAVNCSSDSGDLHVMVSFWFLSPLPGLDGVCAYIPGLASLARGYSLPPLPGRGICAADGPDGARASERVNAGVRPGGAEET